MNKNIVLVSEYDGTNYAGWQRQNNAIAVQNCIEDALTKLTKENVTVYGCSRTDAGVHARAHYCHFFSNTSIPVERIPLAIQAFLPSDISVKFAKEMPENFHARFQTIGKKYSYYIWNKAYRSALHHRYSYHEARPLDRKAMQEAALHFIGEHDFASCMATGSSHQTTVRKIHALSITEEDGLIRIEVCGNAFLYNMVRIIAGTLLYVGLGKISPDAIATLLLAKDRKGMGITLEAQGLFLDAVYYPRHYDLSCYNGKSSNLDELLTVEEQNFGIYEE